MAVLTISSIAYGGQLVTVDNPPTNPVNTSGGGSSVGTTTVTFNGIAQPVTSTYAVVTDTWNVNVNIQRLNGASVTTDGGGSINVAVPSGNVFGIAITTVSFGPQIRLGSTIAVTNAVGTTLTVVPFSSGTYTVTPGSGPWVVTQGTGTYTVTPGTGVFAVAAALGQISVGLTTTTFISGPTSILGSTTAVTNAVGTTLTVVPFSSGTYTVTPGTGTFPVSVTISTIGAINPGGQSLSVAIASGSISNTGFNVNNTPTVLMSTGPVNGSTVAVTNFNGSLTVNITSGSISNTSFGATQAGAWTVNAVPSTGSFTVVPFSSGTYTVTPGTGVFTDNNFAQNKSTDIYQALVTTSAFVTTVGAQSSTMTIAVDGLGRAEITSLPFGIIKSTWNTNCSTQSATEVIIIASAPAGQYTYMCDCAFTNTVNAGQVITLWASTNGNTNNENYSVALSSSTTAIATTGLGCADPFMRSANSGQITLKPTTTVTSTAMHCRYYQGP